MASGISAYPSQVQSANQMLQFAIDALKLAEKESILNKENIIKICSQNKLDV